MGCSYNERRQFRSIKGTPYSPLILDLFQIQISFIFSVDRKGNPYASNIEICDSLDQIIGKLKLEARYGGHFVLMSNGSFGGIYSRLLKELG